MFLVVSVLILKDVGYLRWEISPKQPQLITWHEPRVHTETANCCGTWQHIRAISKPNCTLLHAHFSLYSQLHRILYFLFSSEIPFFFTFNISTFTWVAQQWSLSMPHSIPQISSSFSKPVPNLLFQSLSSLPLTYLSHVQDIVSSSIFNHIEFMTTPESQAFRRPDFLILFATLPVSFFSPTQNDSFIHSVFCLTTGPKSLIKPAHYIVRSRAFSFRRQYPILFLRSSSSFLRLLPRLPVTSIPQFIFPLLTCRRRQFIHKMLPIQLAFRLLAQNDNTHFNNT
jgi:hypothetical protein